MSATSDYVVLRGGAVVALPALRLAWTLEERGFRFEAGEDDRIVVRPGSALTAEDEAAIRAWRADLISIIKYEVPAEVEATHAGG